MNRGPFLIYPPTVNTAKYLDECAEKAKKHYGEKLYNLIQEVAELDGEGLIDFEERSNMAKAHLNTNVFQDGARFYDEFGLIANYSYMVKHDYDVIGAQAARFKFVEEYPEYGYISFE